MEGRAWNNARRVAAVQPHAAARLVEYRDVARARDRPVDVARALGALVPLAEQVMAVVF